MKLCSGLSDNGFVQIATTGVCRKKPREQTFWCYLLNPQGFGILQLEILQVFIRKSQILWITEKDPEWKNTLFMDQ